MYFVSVCVCWVVEGLVLSASAHGERARNRAYYSVGFSLSLLCLSVLTYIHGQYTDEGVLGKLIAHIFADGAVMLPVLLSLPGERLWVCVTCVS